ncbi:MAG: sugar transferase [Deltaproteobacteria bacterium]|nr:sugar transferase [Deltaproteobacteria bacterium]
MKRLLDVALAGVGLVVAAPVIAACAVAIKLDSPGPVMFRHERVGRGKKRIETLKLRTMTTDASRTGSPITAGQDPRITRVGRWLRKTKLDELPQLWNVVRGDMSIVGPRPEVPRFVEQYDARWQPVFDVRPGLTDLASITFRDEEGVLALARDHERAYRQVIMPLKLELAVEGVQRMSVVNDLLIIARTLGALFGLQSPRQAAVLAEARRRIHELEAHDVR